jgi:hypothetical protein
MPQFIKIKSDHNGNKHIVHNERHVYEHVGCRTQPNGVALKEGYAEYQLHE